MPEQTINGVYYFFETNGSGDPLVLLHGFTGSSANWQEHLPALAAHYRVITIDVLGHGRSAAPADPDRYRMERAAADVTAVVSHVFAAPAPPPFHLLGYSMGGRLALYIALHYPRLVRSLILESASPGLETSAARDARRQRDEALADWIEVNGIAAFAERWEALPLWASQAQMPAARRAALRVQRLQNSPQGLANSLRGLGTGAQPSLWERLPHLTLPLLLLAGALDEKFVNIHRRMADLLVNPQIEVVDGAGHTVHWERPLLFQQLVLNFLEMRTREAFAPRGP